MQQFFIFLSFFPSFSRSAVLCNSSAVRGKTVNFVSSSGREERSREGDEKMMNWRELESCKLRCKICRIGAFGYVSFCYSLCCYRNADHPSVVVEVVGWDGIDPLPELPLFHSTAEDSFGGSLYNLKEPAIFWLEGWRAFMRFHRGDDEAPTQQAPVLARFRSFLFRYYGENWEAMVLSESGKVLLFELRAMLAGWLGLVMKQREEFAQAIDNWPQFVFWARVRSLAEAGGFLSLDWATTAGGVILPRRYSRLMPVPILCVGSIQLYWDCTFQNLWEKYIVKFKTRWHYHLLLRVELLKLLGKNKVKIV